MKEVGQFISALDKKDREMLLEAASDNINPDSIKIQAIYDQVLEALIEIETPRFADHEYAAYSFQAIFQARLVDEWLVWLDTQLKERTNGDISLSNATGDESRRFSGATIKGPHSHRFLNRESDNVRKLVIFGPYLNPVEIFPA